MMRKLGLFFISLLLLSCSVSNELREQRKQWNYTNWERLYKERAFCLCVLNGYENKEIKNLFVANDRSFYSPLGQVFFDTSLNKLIIQQVNKIKSDSINSLNVYPEDLQSVYHKRDVMNFCLSFYNSSELDSLVKIEKKKWRKLPNITNKILEELPTY